MMLRINNLVATFRLSIPPLTPDAYMAGKTLAQCGISAMPFPCYHHEGEAWRTNSHGSHLPLVKSGHKWSRHLSGRCVQSGAPSMPTSGSCSSPLSGARARDAHSKCGQFMLDGASYVHTLSSPLRPSLVENFTLGKQLTTRNSLQPCASLYS